MFGLSNFIITEFLLIFYSLVTNVLYSYISLLCNIIHKNLFLITITYINIRDEGPEKTPPAGSDSGLRPSQGHK